mgnify:CR=1 FL=1
MPGSWELTVARDQRILVSIIMPPDLTVTMDFAQGIRNIQLPPGGDFMRMAGLPFGPARNQCAKTALENGYHLAFLDADIRVPPDSFIKLLGTGLDLVGGLYFQRFYPFLPVCFNEGRDDKGNVTKVPITGWKPGDIFPATFVPSGLTLYRRRLLEAMFSRFPRPFEWGVDTAPVPTENGQVPPFSEDFSFSWRARQLGFQPFIHSGVVGLHECRAVVGPKWLLPYPSNDPYHGVVGVA